MGADGMGQGVHAAQPLLEGGGAHGGGAQHVGPGLDIAAVFIGARQGLGGQAHAFQGDALGHRVIGRGAQGLEAMHEGVDAGGRRNVRRQAERQFGIAEHDGRQHGGVEDDRFDLDRFVGDDAGAPHFRARARGRRHGDDRGQALGLDPCPVVADVFEIPQGPLLGHHQGHRLGRVERRAAAEGDHPVVPAPAIGGDTLIDVAPGGIALYLREQTGRQAGGLVGGDGLPDHGEIAQALVGDQQRPHHAQFAAGRRQFRDHPGAEAHGGGEIPASGDCFAHDRFILARVRSRCADGSFWAGSASRSPATTTYSRARSF